MSVRVSFFTLLSITLLLAGNVVGAGKRNSISIGLQGGLSLSKSGNDLNRIYFAYIFSPVDRGWEGTRGTGGVQVHWGMTEMFGLQSEFMYLRKGSRLGNGLSEYTVTVSIDNLEVPLLLTFSPLPHGKLVPVLMVGPYLDFVLHKNITSYVPRSLQDDIVVKTLGLPLAPTVSGGLSFECSFGMKVGHGVCYVTSRYNLGLSHSLNSYRTYISRRRDRFLQLYAGYSFGIYEGSEKASSDDASIPPPSEHLKVGCKGGFTLGKIQNDGLNYGDSQKKSMLHSFGGGINFSLPVSRTFSLQPELLIIQKGCSYGVPWSSWQMTIRATMLEVPVLLTWHPNVRWRLRPELFAGPYVDFPVNARAKMWGDRYWLSGETNIKSLVRTTHVGATAGIGNSFSVGKIEITIEARCDYGLNRMFAKELHLGPLYLSQDSSPYSFLFLTGIRFHL